jgi:hypothetical protein
MIGIIGLVFVFLGWCTALNVGMHLTNGKDGKAVAKAAVSLFAQSAGIYLFCYWLGT